MTDLTVSLRLLLKSRELAQGLQTGSRDVRRFAGDSQRALGRLDETLKSIRNRAAALGVGVAVGVALRDSARLDKQLIQIGQTAGAGRDQVRGLRDEIFRMARDTGRPLDTLLGGFNNLIQAGLDWRAALAATRAINPASAVTGAPEDVLAGALSVGASAYNFDLAQPRLAVDLLDQMVVAGRLGNAELEDLAGIFSRVGVNAKAANFGFAQTLAFVEGLSQVERAPERLSTLADSTLRLFNNLSYQKGAAKATGVRFFNPDGSSRQALDVLDDIAGKYRALTTDQARSRFIDSAFGKTDLDTQKGLRTLLSGDALAQIRRYTREIESASGTVARDLPAAIDNAVDQSARLKTSLREAADLFAKPINRTIADLIEFGLDKREAAGFELGAGGTAAAAAAALVGTGLLARGARSVLGRIPGVGGAAADAAGTAIGLAQGQAVEKAGLGTAVFVTNWPGELAGGGGGLGGAAAAAAGGAALARGGLLGRLLTRLGLTSAAGVGSFALGSAGVMAAGAGGYEVGSLISRHLLDGTDFNDRFGRAVATALASFNEEARDALYRRHATQDVLGSITVTIDSQGRPSVTRAQGNGVDLDVSLRRGALMPAGVQ